MLKRSQCSSSQCATIPWSAPISGETNSRLARLFDYARTVPCVLFFDEFNSIGKERGDVHETGEIKRVVSFLLMQIDQLPSYVVTVAATNHAELLDRAVWRRFQLRLAMPQPTRAALAVLLERQINLWPEPTGIEANTLATCLGHVSFAEALEFCQTVRRQHILSLSNSSLKDIINEQLHLLDGRSSRRKNQMPHDPEKPLLRLNEPRDGPRRRSGGGGSRARTFDQRAQARAHGPVFQRLQIILDRPDAALQLRADANSLAPERLLVFEVTRSNRHLGFPRA